MGILSCGKVRFRTFIPLFSTLGYVTRNIFNQYFPANNKDKIPNYLCFLLMFLGESLAGIFEVIFRCNSQKTFCSVYPNKTLLYTIKIISVLILFGFLDLIGCLDMFYIIVGQYTKETFSSFIMKLCEFFFASIFYSFVFKIKLYRHHYLSFCLIIIGLILFKLGLSRHFNFIDFLISQISNLIYGTLEVTEKWLMDKKNISLYFLLFVEGLSGTFFMTLIILLRNFGGQNIFIKSLDLVNDLEILNKDFWTGTIIIKSLVYLFTSLAYNIMMQLTNRIFNPTYRVISDTFSYFIIVIFSVFLDKASSVSFIYPLIVFGIIILLIGLFMFNEIIIFHFLDLDRYTNIEITNRASTEHIDNLNELSQINNEVNGPLI